MNRFLNTSAVRTPDENSRFPQQCLSVGNMQVIVSDGELFNHVDDGLPMWSGDGDRFVALDIPFIYGFARAPLVLVGLSGMDSAHDQNLRFELTAQNVKKSGFCIVLRTWSDTHIARASVVWQAIGLAKPNVVEEFDKHMTE